jgi:hypothetical protein
MGLEAELLMTSGTCDAAGRGDASRPGVGFDRDRSDAGRPAVLSVVPRACRGGIKRRHGKRHAIFRIGDSSWHTSRSYQTMWPPYANDYSVRQQPPRNFSARHLSPHHDPLLSANPAVDTLTLVDQHLASR